jgi:hypothetical protein
MINGNGKIGDTVNAGLLNTGNYTGDNSGNCGIVGNHITVNGSVNINGRGNAENIKETVQPKLSFQLKKNPNYTYLCTSPYGESEYCIFCRNDDKQAIRIKRIFLNDGQVTIYNSGDVSLAIKPLEYDIHHILYTELCNIKNYYREHKIKECTIIVDTSEGEYCSNFDLT